MQTYSKTRMGPFLSKNEIGRKVMTEMNLSTMQMRFHPIASDMFDVFVLTNDTTWLLAGALWINDRALYLASYEAGQYGTIVHVERDTVVKLDPETLEWKDWGMSPATAVLTWVKDIETEKNREVEKRNAINTALSHAMNYAKTA